jgi:endothelin-converting enzyme/putative endopeptidase
MKAIAVYAAFSLLASPSVAPAEATLPYTPGLDVSAIDRSVDPCIDFYRYACGGWQRNNPIPPDQTAWNVYRKMADENLRFLRDILEQAAAADQPDPVSRKIGDFYAACMDEARVEELGATPLAPDLAAIEHAASTSDLAALLARLQREAVNRSLLFEAGSDQDPDDAERQIAQFDQGGLGLPDRDHYFRDDAKSNENRERYVAHIAGMLELLGDAPEAARAGAVEIMRLETALAASSMTRVERRDPYKMRHKLGRAERDAMAPNFDWHAYLSALKAPVFDVGNVTAPAFFAEVSSRLRSEPLAVWKDYLRFHVANDRAPLLSSAFVNADFEFYAKYLRGAKELQPRWKRCVRLTDAQLGEALGEVFVRKTFTPQTQAAALDMTQRIEAAMERRLRTRDWMSERTKQAALAKLRAIRNKIGYPAKWRDYSAVTVRRDDFAGNALRAAAFEFDRQLAKIGQPVDRDEWFMSPPTVNAYFDAQRNDINFPAGVLQPPLYDPKMDDAPNYGNTGGTIGHELSHGFDDHGRQFDAKGNLADWWTERDAKAFEERAKCISDQYGRYVAIDDIRVNSAMTLGEDIADLAGQVLAYAAWKQATRGAKPYKRDGLTPDQRFFVGFAQWACSNMRPEEQRERALTDYHSPPRYRINGVVVNMPEFAKAFACKAGAPMRKPAASTCSIW